MSEQLSIQARQLGRRSPLSLLRVSGDATKLVELANLSDDELSGLGVVVDDAQLMRRWLQRLARRQYKALIEELNEHLKLWTVKARMYVNSSRKLVYRLEDDPASDRAIIAAVIARTFNGDEHERVHVCKECKQFFVSLSGHRRDFCSTTHGNTFKQRALRERKKQETN